MLTDERRFFEEHLADWLSRYPGRFVVVRGEELIGVFDDQDQALAAGARRFGLTAFLVRRIQPVADEETVPALTLGILNAGHPRSVPR